LTKQPNLVPDIFSKSILWYQAVGTQAKVAKIPFKLKDQIEKIFRFLLASPRLGTKGRIYGKYLAQASVTLSTEQYWYKYPHLCFGSHKLTKTEV